MTDKKSNSRRKVLLGLTGTIAGANQLPTKWTKPIVEAVILPAHAQMSTTLGTSFRGNPGLGVADSMMDDVISAFVSTAHAGGFPATGDACVNSPDRISFSLNLLIGTGEFVGFYSTSGTVGNTKYTVNDSNGCFPSRTVGVTAITSAGANLDINGQFTILPEGTGCPANPGGGSCGVVPTTTSPPMMTTSPPMMTTSPPMMTTSPPLPE